MPKIRNDKVTANAQSLIHLYFFSQKEQRCTQELGFVYLPSLLSFLVRVLFGMPFLHLFSLVMICFYTFFGNVLIYVVK